MQTLAQESLTTAWKSISEAIDTWIDAVRNRPRQAIQDARDNALATIHDYTQGDKSREKAVRELVDKKLGSEYYLY